MKKIRMFWFSIKAWMIRKSAFMGLLDGTWLGLLGYVIVGGVTAQDLEDRYQDKKSRSIRNK